MRAVYLIIIALIAVATSNAPGAAEGLHRIESPFGPETTMNRLETAVLAKGMKVFARIDHAAGAASIGGTLRPTELLIFGNPRAGTAFMQCAQSAGIDLPLKALVWQDEDGRVWLGYNRPDYLAARHAAENCPVVSRMANALAGFAAAATGGS